MPSSIINSDDGVISGTSGLKSSGGDDGVLQLQSNGADRLALKAAEVVVNDGGADVDFRVEGDTDANLLFVDAGNDRVGIGTNAPLGKVDITAAQNDVSTGSFTSPHLRLAASAVTDTNGFTGVAYSTSALNNYGWTCGAQRTFTDASVGAFIWRFHNNSATGTERMRITSDGYLRMASGSGGIQFGGDTAAANALDDYEEGTWTPVFTSETTGAQTVGYTGQLGTYTKIGRFVFCRFVITWSSWTRTGSVIQINNLPFNPSAANVLSGAINGATNISFTNRSGGAGTQINIENYGGNIFTIASTASGMNVGDSRLDPSAFGTTGGIGGFVVYTT